MKKFIKRLTRNDDQCYGKRSHRFIRNYKNKYVEYKTKTVRFIGIPICVDFEDTGDNSEWGNNENTRLDDELYDTYYIKITIKKYMKCFRKLPDIGMEIHCPRAGDAYPLSGVWFEAGMVQIAVDNS